MAKLHVVGPRDDLHRTLAALYRLRSVQLLDAPAQPELELSRVPDAAGRERRVARLGELAAEVEALLELAGIPAGAGEQPGGVDVDALAEELEAVGPRARAAAERMEALDRERRALERYVEPLAALMPLIPGLSQLDDGQLAAAGLDTAALVLETDDDQLVDALREAVAERLGRRFELAWRRIDPHAVGCLLVFPHAEGAPVHDILSHERIRHVALPERYERLSLRAALDAMRRRLEELPAEIEAAAREVREILAPVGDRWPAQLARLRAELQQLEAAGRAGVTERAFVLAGWMPRAGVPELRRALETEVGDRLAVTEAACDERDAGAPVLLRNRSLARPYESLVSFLDLPKPGTFDPTILMAVFVPLMFGAMVGDVVYGALLLALGLVLRRRLRQGSPALADLSRVLVAGSAWAIVFGFLYGEALGNFARRYLGMEALWVYRGNADALEPLFIFALALGGAHVVLGLGIGVWQSTRAGDRRSVVDKIGTLLVLSGLFALAGVALDMLPPGSVGPAVAAVVVGAVVAIALHGAIGPIELFGVVGNVLSYLRLAAVGLASVYLAIVANEFAVTGPLWIGVIVAALLHALNVALAGFSPTIQSLRLHYVELFDKFFEAGGRPFRPFGPTPTPQPRST